MLSSHLLSLHLSCKSHSISRKWILHVLDMIVPEERTRLLWTHSRICYNWCQTEINADLCHLRIQPINLYEIKSKETWKHKDLGSALNYAIDNLAQYHWSWFLCCIVLKKQDRSLTQSYSRFTHVFLELGVK